jgi:hypothetical protein
MASCVRLVGFSLQRKRGSIFYVAIFLNNYDGPQLSSYVYNFELNVNSNVLFYIMHNI